MSATAGLSVLIPTYGAAPRLEQTLATVAEAQAAHPTAALRQVMVVENGGRGAAGSICARFADRLPMAFRSVAPPGKNRAFQVVLPELGDDLIVFLDDDVRVAPNLLSVYAPLVSRGAGEYYGGTVEVEYEVRPPEWLMPYLPRTAVGFRPSPGEWQFLGPNCAAFASDVRRTGGFNPNFGPGSYRAGTAGNPMGSETQLMRQLRDAGVVPVAVPEAVVWHWVPEDRCTPDWALHRSRRLAMTYGLADAPTAGSVAGVPPWLARQLLTSLPSLALSWVSGSPRRRFERQLEWHRAMGTLEGIRLRTRAEGTPGPRKHAG